MTTVGTFCGESQCRLLGCTSSWCCTRGLVLQKESSLLHVAMCRGFSSTGSGGDILVEVSFLTTRQGQWRADLGEEEPTNHKHAQVSRRRGLIGSLRWSCLMSNERHERRRVVSTRESPLQLNCHEHERSRPDDPGAQGSLVWKHVTRNQQGVDTSDM